MMNLAKTIINLKTFEVIYQNQQDLTYSNNLQIITYPNYSLSNSPMPSSTTYTSYSHYRDFGSQFLVHDFPILKHKLKYRHNTN